MSKIGYIRISTTEQNTARQDESLSLHQLDKIFTDKCSGSTIERDGLTQMMEYVRTGDHIYVHAIDRLARNVSNLREIVDNLKEQGVSITFISNNLTFTPDATNPMSELMLNMLASFAEFERSLIKERQREGIAKAKERGVYKGRPESIDREKIKEMIEEGVKPTTIQKELGLSKASFYRIKAELAA